MTYQSYDQQQYFSPPPPPPPPAKTNGKSIGALVLGILSLMIPFVGFLLGIIAIILASISFKEIRIRYEQGKGMAIAGLVTGILGTLFGLFLIAVIVISLIVAGSETYNNLNDYYNNNYNNINFNSFNSLNDI
ncbi:DUF4190 domain-containing protein [Paenibacillus sp. NFR01]|uniref:DUF4190 domain-containing protein n=1 Tax=Paenibacillus sp. NFR01 TaxID=1566279 RepID=UPI0008D44BC1|nr:DUF4190 domain-containing protein [Paenibacillus sp. NFR01]SET28089.1 protein of unknown function [Paenibacillus sp. NFR01]